MQLLTSISLVAILVITFSYAVAMPIAHAWESTIPLFGSFIWPNPMNAAVGRALCYFNPMFCGPRPAPLTPEYA